MSESDNYSSDNYSFKTHPWEFEANKSFEILNVYRKTRSNVANRFIIESTLFDRHKRREGFINEIVQRGASIASGPCYGGRVKFDVNKGLYVRSEYYPGVLKALPQAQRFETQTGEPIKAIDHSLLDCRRFDSDDDYLTESTALVRYEGQRYVFKGAENLSDAPLIYKEFRTLRRLNHPFIMSPSNLLVKPDKDSNRVLGFLLKYHPHGNLREYVFKLRSKNDIPLSLFCKWAVQLAQAFQHLLYTERFFYQNIKPENCVVDEEKNLVLIDFEHGSQCRSEFRAPEVVLYHDHKAEEKATVFSVARTLWVVWEVMSTNKYPERGKHGEYCKTIFTETTAAVPQGWKDMILQCVDPIPNKRPSLQEIFKLFEKESESFEKPKFTRDPYLLRKRKRSQLRD